jgi:sulfur transporter
MGDLTSAVAAPTTLPEGVAKRTGGVRVTATQMGALAGLLAVLAGALFDVRPPEAYGLCMACHARDLVNWIVNNLIGAHLAVAPASLVFPVLTTIGVVVGAVAGATSASEFQWRTPESPLRTFVYGAVVMNFALLAGGCAIRLLLRTAAADVAGILGFAGLIGGVAAGTIWLRWRATR